MSKNQFEVIKEKIKDFPTQSGVYLMKNHIDKIIYVGKAKNLKNRVKSYFTESKDLSAKTKILVQHIQEIEYILTKTEVEAFLLEASLIKKHKPKYNIRLKDDKTYPYIKLSYSDDFPRLYLSRKVKKDGSLYFGPYTSGYAVHDTIRFLNRTFKIRDCTDAVFKTRTRPCMTYQIGRCAAPCVKLISKEEYRSELEGALMFLKGKNKKVIASLKQKMWEASEQEKFELAAKLRDSLNSIKSILDKQSVINEDQDLDQDAINFYGDQRGNLVQLIHVRAGKVIGSTSHFLNHIVIDSQEDDHREWLVDFMNQFYSDNFIPDEILLPIQLGEDLTKLFQAVLKERAGHLPRIRFATDNKGTKLIEMAGVNAKAQFEKYVSKSEAKKRGLELIQEKLELKALPDRIECYDISTFQGKETVASQVVFEDGVPAREFYRRYKIKTVQGVDDYASMKEVLSRRFTHEEWREPDLIVIDGGKGQLSAALQILQELKRDYIPIVGLAKSRTKSDFQSSEVTATEERFFLPGRANPVTFKPQTEAFQILVGIRDEAHRFAITYHRKLRENSSIESELDMVVGLGETRKKILLKNFNSIEELKSASIEEISKLKGFNQILAERILLQLNESDENNELDENEM